MERYLYKAKRTDTGEWVEGNLLKGNSGLTYTCSVYTELGDFIQAHAAEVDQSTLCQCTNLIDRHGKKIWENDIVKAVTRDSGNSNPEEDEEDFWESETESLKESFWTIEYKERVTQGNGYYFYGTDRRFNIRATQSVITNCKCEVVGNIFDNPELLGR